ncbi:unnamed protein product [Cuscuta epithymum]|uniref:F-box domain-containing protein n=1 Tax=Cuscuta epithymum TaxID=186058 RepID=A0AAV0D9W4_9ASTE|nr:unnamed protein product [Cuscuta epithymum]CAH9124084.1 unnamed protein product [Cuscuta epithymum]
MADMTMMRRDRISELPAEILDKIMGLLPIQEAARMAVLSTFWKDIWLNLTELNFDFRFNLHIHKNSSYRQSDTCLFPEFSVINKVLMQHNGHIHKFVFVSYFHGVSLKSWSYHIDQWLLLVTQKGVEEIFLSIDREVEYEYILPSCIYSCPTLKKLYISGVSIERVIAPCVIPNITSLCLVSVACKPNARQEDLKIDLPMLENLSFIRCKNMIHCNIAAPVLGALAIKGPGSISVNLNWRSLRTLDLDALSLKSLVEDFCRSLQPPALNVELLKLSNVITPNDDVSSAFIHLLKLCPKLVKLDMNMQFLEGLRNCLESGSELSMELYDVAQTRNLLHSLSLEFDECESCMPLVKGLLASFPTLEKFIVSDLNSGFKQKILEFPRASTKVELVLSHT